MPQPCKKKTYLRPVVEARRTARTPWDPCHVQAATDLRGVDIGAHQHRMVSWKPPRGDRAANLVRNPVRLIRSRAESAKRHRVRRGPLGLGAQLLGDPKLRLKSLWVIESDQSTRRGEDRSRASEFLVSTTFVASGYRSTKPRMFSMAAPRNR
jgi:hypothetical protein